MPSPQIEISIVIPAYNEAPSLNETCQGVKNALLPLGLNYEIIIIDDGSTDNTQDVLADLKKQGLANLKTLSLYARSGQTRALKKGFALAQGSVIVTLDADLQFDAADIPLLLEKIDAGYSLVCAWRYQRCDPFLKIHGSKIFNFILRLLFNCPLHDVNSALRALRKTDLNNITLHNGDHRFIPILFQLQGLSITEIKVRHNKRKYGLSKYRVFRLGWLPDLMRLVFLYRSVGRKKH